MGMRTKDSPQTQVVADSDAIRRARSKRLRVWSLVACLVVLGGATGAVLAARSVAASNAAKAREAFVQSSSEVASTLQLAIRREQDLAFAAAGFFLGDPDATNAQFRDWATSVQALARFPELVGWSDVLRVPAAQLGAYAAKFVDRVLGRDRRAAGRFTRSRAAFGPTTALPVRAGRGSPSRLPPIDYCAGVTGVSLLASRDSGQGEYGAVSLGPARFSPWTSRSTAAVPRRPR